MEKRHLYLIAAFDQATAPVLGKLAVDDLLPELMTLVDASAPEASPSVNDDVILAIMLCAKPTPRVEAAAAEFVRAGVLTLIMCAEGTPAVEACCDAYSTVPAERMASSVRAMLRSISEEGLINVDFNDFAATLRGAGRFLVAHAEVAATLPGRMEMLANWVDGVTTPERMALAQRAMLMLSAPKTMQPPLRTDEVCTGLMGIASRFPQDVDLIWGVVNPAVSPTPQPVVGLTIIVGGTDL